MKMLKPIFFASCLSLAFFQSGCNDDEKTPAEPKDSANVSESENQPDSNEPPEKKVFVLSNGSRIAFTGTKGEETIEGSFSNFVGKFELLGGSPRQEWKKFHHRRICLRSFAGDQEFSDKLKGADFFDVEKFPIARFQLRNAVPGEVNIFEVSGILDLHGVGKKISFPAKITMTGKQTLMDFSADISLNRKGLRPRLFRRHRWIDSG